MIYLKKEMQSNLIQKSNQILSCGGFFWEKQKNAWWFFGNFHSIENDQLSVDYSFLATGQKLSRNTHTWWLVCVFVFVCLPLSAKQQQQKNNHREHKMSEWEIGEINWVEVKWHFCFVSIVCLHTTIWRSQCILSLLISMLLLLLLKLLLAMLLLLLCCGCFLKQKVNVRRYRCLCYLLYIFFFG